LKVAVTITLKKDVLDPQGKVVLHTLQNMGMKTLSNIRQGKYFEIEIEETNQEIVKKDVDSMCKKLLANLIIEDYKIDII
jgi:phosphoribosylformylglycinamidine synthase PurS subunit|tara:strand:+ start:279 stop:518 length:240 start_codon:yes stop_codon:yes gene_type:complete